VAEADDLDDMISRIGRLASPSDRVAEYDRLLECFPGHAELYFRRGMSRNVLGDKRGAIKDMSDAIELNPAEPAMVYFRGLFNLDERNFSEGLADLEQAIVCDRKLDSEYYSEAARFLVAVASLYLGDFDRALHESSGLEADTSAYAVRKVWTLDEVRERALSRSCPG